MIMLKTLIRKELKNQWEKRVALTPADAAELAAKGLPLSVEPSDFRVYPDTDYFSQYKILAGKPANAELVIGIKEPPVDSIKPGQVHLAFSHTIKGQDYNMPLLQRFIDQKATLIDYEPIVDEIGVRTIAFGRFAGIAGAIDSFYTAGLKYKMLGSEFCLPEIKQCWQYASIEQIRQELDAIKLKQGEPLRVLINGNGNVGMGSVEVCQWLGLPEINIERLIAGEVPDGSWYAVAGCEHVNQRKDGDPFDMQDFIEQGAEAYTSSFDQLLGKFNILLQAFYWTDKYPKHLDLKCMRKHKDRLPLVVGDISCDINGSLACTSKASDIEHPAFTFVVDSGETLEGVQAEGVSVMSIDNLPCELPLDSSRYFSNILKGYLPNLASIQLDKPFEQCGLIPELARAVIVYKGKLTPDFRYLASFLDDR